MSEDSLEQYGNKRDLRKSPEPHAKGDRTRGKRPRFVIHRHDATAEHYDFRLEAGGVLKSWAVPKGPSTDPSDKRLAIRTEDHPVEYIDFEGVIPEDAYGAGTVMVWDRGTYRNLKEDDDPTVERQVEDGHVTVRLRGKKLTGGYALTKTGTRDGKEQWLLVKMDDDEADARRNPVSTEPKSVKSDRTMKQIRDEEGDS